MSPRRMDISSLLCNANNADDDNDDNDDNETILPSTARTTDSLRYTERPRTIDALIHRSAPSPSSLFSILNNPDPTLSPSNRRLSRPSHPTSSSPPSSPVITLHRPPHSHSHSPTEHRLGHSHPHGHPSSPSPVPTTQHSPFLGLDALVHVASEERRRISTTSTSSPTTARSRTLSDNGQHQDGRFEHDASNARLHVDFVHDHDRHSPHYSHPLSSKPHHQRFLDHSPPTEDHARPHKRVRDTGSPPPSDPLLGSSRTQGVSHSSASSLDDYATVRRQPMNATRSAPALLAEPPSDHRVISLSQTSSSLPPSSPFLQPHPPFHVNTPTYQSPRQRSPQRHSPQQLRSHYSPTQSFLVASPSVEPMSPRFGHGPRMAGGITVLASDSTTANDVSGSGSSNFRRIRREVPRDHLMYEVPGAHARIPLQAPVPRLPESVKDDKLHAIREVQVPFSKVEGTDYVHHKQTQSCHPPLALGSRQATNLGAHDAASAREFAHPLPERHPIRVWEEQSERSQRISPSPIAPVSHPVSDAGKQITEERKLSDISPMNSEVCGGTSISNDVDPALCGRDGVVEILSPSPNYTRRESSPVLVLEEVSLAPKTSTSESPRTRRDRRSMSPDSAHSLSRVHREPQAHLADASSPKASPPRSPGRDASGVAAMDPDVRFRGGSDSGPSAAQVMLRAQVSPPSSDTIMSGPSSNEVKLIASSPTPQLPIPTEASVGQNPLVGGHDPVVSPSFNPVTTQMKLGSISWSPRHDPVKEECRSLPEGMLTSAFSQPGPSASASQSPEPEPEPSVSDSFAMEIDEELLGLIEDTPVVPAVREAQVQPDLASSTGQAPSTSVGSREVPSSSLTLSSHLVTKTPLTVADEDKERTSMPPPAPRIKKTEKEKSGTSTGSKKKKDVASKAPTKPKQPPKPRAKLAPKTKAKSTAMGAPSKSSALRCGSNANTRSRSGSVLPGNVEDHAAEPEAEESEREDDKLYCVCKTRYDEDRTMIACDRCDEWFHTQCVKMPDLEIDLVDQFVCPPCIQKNPHLRTTWKRRCLFGLEHENPSSPSACHKPSRGAFSKYCSDECGIKYMQMRVARWENSGGNRDLLWESVKNAVKREGVVVRVDAMAPSKMEIDISNSQLKQEPFDAATKRRVERDVARLNAQLEEVVKEREFMKRELDMVLWREKVVDSASERAKKVDECGWDQRLCFGEEEWADFGAEVLESYEEERTKAEQGDDVMLPDGAAANQGEWWCSGKKKCERHAGWQKLRNAEVTFDKETKEAILLKLTAREREIRKYIEDILYPQSNSPAKALHPESLLNGSGKSQSLDNVSGRERKKPS